MVDSGDRRAYFPKIEAKHGKPIDYWFDQLADLPSSRYRDHMAFLINEHGFSQTHANAVAMFYRGSESSSRHPSPQSYLESLAPAQRTLASNIISAVQSLHPELELVMAWNQPMFRQGDDYVFGLSSSAGHLTINPWVPIAELGMDKELASYHILKHTIRIPLDWQVDADLLGQLVAVRLAALGNPTG